MLHKSNFKPPTIQGKEIFTCKIHKKIISGFEKIQLIDLEVSVIHTTTK
jgi:hypothetical protein